jgi:hypothetical protein
MRKRLIRWHVVLLIAADVIGGCATEAAPPATRASTPLRSPLRHVIATGMVTALGVSQQEPGATPQNSFYLRTIGSDGAAQAILVVMPAPRFPCLEGARASLEGDLSPADALFPLTLLAPKVLSCNGVKVPP